MMKRFLLGLLLSTLVVPAALAMNVKDISNVAAPDGTNYGAIGATPHVCVPAAVAGFPRSSLFLFNSTGSAVTIGYAFGTPTIGNAGTVTIPQGGSWYWPAGSAPAQEIDCVAASTAALTVQLGNN